MALRQGMGIRGFEDRDKNSEGERSALLRLAESPDRGHHDYYSLNLWPIVNWKTQFRESAPSLSNTFVTPTL